MTVPTRLGVSGTYTHTGTGTASHNVSALNIPVGSWVVASVILSSSSVSISTPPAGWRVLLPSAIQTYGSRRLALYGRVWQAGDTTIAFTKSASATAYLHLMWGAGSKPVTDWQVGMVGVRTSSNAVAGQSQQGGSNTTSVAPTVTTTLPDGLALGLFYEASATAETDAQLSLSTGLTLWQHLLPSGAIERLSIAYRTTSTAGSVIPAGTMTYPVSQSGNGAGVFVVVPGVVAAPGLPVELQTAGGVVTARLTVWNGTAEVTPSALTVHTGAPALTEYTAMGAAAPSSADLTPVSSLTDLGANGWTGSLFYLASNPGGTVSLVGGRLWVPTGSPHIGKTAVMGWYVQSAGKITRSLQTPNSIVIAVAQSANKPSKVLTAGWNEFRFATPVTVPWDDGIAIAFKIGTGTDYVAGPSSGSDRAAFQAAAGSPFLSENTATVARGFYGNSAGTGTESGTDWAYQGAWYGADVILGW